MHNNLFEAQLCQKQADLFLLFLDYNFDIKSTILLFMNSELAYRFDKEYDSYQYQNVFKIFDDFESKYVFEIKNNKCNVSRNAVEYIGYLYRYICINKKISSKKLIKICPVKLIIDNYLLWHTLSFEKVIDLIYLEYKKKRISHDKYEANRNENVIVDKLDPHLYSFLAKRILYKLNRDPLIKNLIFNETREDYLFVDGNNEISLEVTRGKQLKSLYDFEIKFIKNKSNKYKKNILFIFSETSPKDDELDYIFRHHFNNDNTFDEIYIYNNKTLYLIDSSNQLIKLPVLIKKCDYNISYKESIKFADL